MAGSGGPVSHSESVAGPTPADPDCSKEAAPKGWALLPLGVSGLLPPRLTPACVSITYLGVNGVSWVGHPC